VSSYWYDATTEASVNAVTALLGTAGTMQIFTGAQPALNGATTGTLLATLKFGNPAFASSTASGGTVTGTANTITAGTAVTNGTASYFALVGTNGSTIVATGTISTSGANLNLNSTVISSGAVISVSSFSITQSETGT
jgi:hypothetical protein